MENEQPPTPFPNVPNPPAEPVRNDSETPTPLAEPDRKEEHKPSETPVQFPKLKLPTDAHTTTVREAAKIFEAQGHPITERTIINWCYPTKNWTARGTGKKVNTSSLSRALNR